MAYYVNAQGDKTKPASEIVKYYYVDLLTNTERPELPKTEVDSIQAAHRANIGQMVKDEVLMLAGPFAGGGGIFILRLESMEEAEELVKRDPELSGLKANYGPSRKGDVMHSLADISKAKRLLNYSPKFDLAQGMTKAIDWYIDALK